jgi:hypothetical protein
MSLSRAAAKESICISGKTQTIHREIKIGKSIRGT